MQVLSFDISGKFAHFRKFHGNNTAFSYSIPPRTTIIGMIAALLGRDKDSYYLDLANDNLKVGIRVLSDLRKSFHRLNYLKIEGTDDFRGKKGRVQTPFEVITAGDLNKDLVRYRIFIASGENPYIFDEIEQVLADNHISGPKQRYNLSLGPANFVGFIDNVKVWRHVEKIEIHNEFFEMHSACNSEEISEIDYPDDAEFKFNFIEEELLPADFIDNNNRELKRMNRILFTTRNMPLRVRINGTVYQLSEGHELQRIQFMEYAGMVTQ